jgi:hypothetical protein
MRMFLTWRNSYRPSSPPARVPLSELVAEARVNGQRHAGDVPGLVGGEKGNRIADITGLEHVDRHRFCICTPAPGFFSRNSVIPGLTAIIVRTAVGWTVLTRMLCGASALALAGWRRADRPVARDTTSNPSARPTPITTSASPSHGAATPGHRACQIPALAAHTMVIAWCKGLTGPAGGEETPRYVRKFFFHSERTVAPLPRTLPPTDQPGAGVNANARRSAQTGASIRNTPCYVVGVANTRFTISTDPAIQAAIKAHAEAAGMDVSAYMVAAAIAQMAADDAAAAVFAPLDAENTAAMEEGATMSAPPMPAFEDLTAEEQLLVHRVISSALGTGEASVA